MLLPMSFLYMFTYVFPNKEKKSFEKTMAGTGRPRHTRPAVVGVPKYRYRKRRRKQCRRHSAVSRLLQSSSDDGPGHSRNYELCGPVRAPEVPTVFGTYRTTEGKAAGDTETGGRSGLCPATRQQQQQFVSHRSQIRLHFGAKGEHIRSASTLYRLPTLAMVQPVQRHGTQTESMLSQQVRSSLCLLQSRTLESNIRR